MRSSEPTIGTFEFNFFHEAFTGGARVNFINLDRIYRIIRIILFWYRYVLSILLILSEKLNIANFNKR